MTCLTELYLPVVYLAMTVFCIDQSDAQKIKTHGSESQGQEEAACTHVFWPTRTSSGLRDHYSELFTWMAALKFENAVTQPP